MRSQIEIRTPTGEVIACCDVSGVVEPGLLPAVEYALAAGLRDAYLRRYCLLPGPLSVAVGRATISQPSLHQFVTRGPVRLAIVRRGDDCHWREDSATVRRFSAEIRSAA